MNTLFQYLIVVSFLFIIACDGKKPDTSTSPQSQANQPHTVKPNNPNDCKASVIQSKGTECSYQLPALENGQTFTGNYKKNLNIHTKGMILGKGMWRCQEGTWYNQYSACFTCEPGRSLEYCQKGLNYVIQLMR